MENSSLADIKKEQGENNELFRLIRQHGLARELPLIVLTLKTLCENKVQIDAGKIYDSQGKQIRGYDLSLQVNRMVGEK